MSWEQPESLFLAEMSFLQSHSGVDRNVSEGCAFFVAAHTELLLFFAEAGCVLSAGW